MQFGPCPLHQRLLRSNLERSLGIVEFELDWVYPRFNW